MTIRWRAFLCLVYGHEWASQFNPYHLAACKRCGWCP
jgi:hypothetical protein